MILFIDTSDFHGLRLAVIEPKDKTPVRQSTSQVAYNENHKTAALLQQFLRKHKVKIKNIKRIVVCSGPGSFTGIRVGVALGQGLAYGLNIPIVAIKKSQVPTDLTKLTKLKGNKQLALNYGRKPNITKPKPR